MNIWETLAIALLQGAEADTPLFVHSAQGSLILNASENLLNGAIAALVARQAAVTPIPVAPAAPATPIAAVPAKVVMNS